MSEHLCFVDVETTGLDPEEDRVIQLSLLKTLKKMNSVGTESEFECEIVTFHFNPDGKKISPGAYRVHGIKDKDLISKPLFSEKVNEILAFVAGRTLIAHNAKFDSGMIASEFKRISSVMPFQFICSMEIIKVAIPNLPGYSLDWLCRNSKIERPEKHSAEEDVIALYKLYQTLELDKYTQPKKFLGLF